MKGIRTIFAAAIGVAALLLTAAPAQATPVHATPWHSTVCSGGVIASGTYANLTITGSCSIPDGAHVTVLGHVTLATNSQLNAITASTVSINGSIWVEPGAKLGLGCSQALTLPPYPGAPPICPNGVSNDHVNGGIYANQPLTLLLDGLTVRGSVISVGGGVRATGTNPGCEQQPGALNFAIKDNVIYGSTLLSAWQGCWIGFIRNVQHGTASLVANRTDSSDSTEIVTNTIHGSLICIANSPAPQVGDSGGAPNAVSGRMLGQCSTL